MTKVEEASSHGVPSAGGDSHSARVNEKLRSVLETYEGDIERLQETVRSQAEEIARLKQLLNHNGTFVSSLPSSHWT